jgi:hypothetical protein
MPLKNYTTKVPANRSIQEIQDTLVKNGAIGVSLRYEQGTGRIEALEFLLQVGNTDTRFPIKLPVDWRAFQRVLIKQGVSRSNDEDYCYRVAWRVVRDWVMAQMALYETQMVSIPQIFLPYVIHKDRRTHFEHVLENPRLLLE